MNLKQIRAILDMDPMVPDSVKEDLIIQVFAEDKNVIPKVMKILEHERESSKEMMLDMNLELSRADVFIEMSPESNPRGRKPKTVRDAMTDKAFVSGKIGEFYAKYKHKIKHCFNRYND